MPPILRSVIFLCPPKGPVLVLRDRETWIGRSSFELSEKAQSVCSRRQACLMYTNTIVQLECHGLNPIHFVVCHAVGFHASQGTPPSSYHLLKKGEVVELTDGDKFFLAPKECLLTVGIKHSESKNDERALQFTPNAGLLNIQDDRSCANQVVLPKATQSKQDSAVGFDEEPRLVQTGALARHIHVEVPSTDSSTGIISNLDPAGHKCFRVDALDNTLVPPCSSFQASLTNNGSIHQVESLKKAVSGRPALAAVLIDTTRSIYASNATKTNVAPDQICPPASGCLQSAHGDIPAAVRSVEGSTCGYSNSPSREILSQGFAPSTNNVDMESRLPLEEVETDHKVAEASEQKISYIAINPMLSTLASGPNFILDDKPSAIMCRLDPKQGPPQSWQPSNSSSSSHFSSYMPSPCENSGVEVDAICENEVLKQAPKIQGNIQAVSPSEPIPRSERQAFDPFSGELAIMSEECNVYDGGRLSKQPELMHLTTLANEGNIQASVGQGIPDGTGPVQGMETVIATVSGYDNLVRARLINLINLTGAVYTGSLTKSNTHVVCWRFKGAKYEMAKKLGKSILNHQWFEDCLNAGVRLPEEPYESSGEVAEPLRWDHSNVQHPSSKAGFVHEQDKDVIFMEDHSRRLLQPTTVVGESSVQLTRSGRTAEHSGQSALPSRSNYGKLDRGKQPVVADLSSPASNQQACNLVFPVLNAQDSCQIRNLTRAAGSEAIDPSMMHRAQEQESDDFWNEVIRTCDDKGKQVANHSYQLLPEALPSAGLNKTRTRRTMHANFPIAGSSSRELDIKFDNEITRGTQDLIDTEAHVSGDVQSQRLCEAIQSHCPVREDSGNEHSEDGHTTRYPEALRKRKHVSTNLSGHFIGKHRRLVRKREILGVSDELPNAVRSTVAITGSQPTLVTDPAQQGASSVDRKAECQQSADLIDTLKESVLKPGQNIGGSPLSNEITCVICHSESKPASEGMLSCGHKFCYPCIQRWADEAKLKSPSCPLCKVPFEYITFREMGKFGADGGSPVLEERVVLVRQDAWQGTHRTNLPSLRTENLCVTCGSRDTSELLLICTNCNERACHTFCLDPPRPPGSSWFCNRCSQSHSRMQTREAYGRLFQGNSPRSSVLLEPDVMGLGMNLATQSGFISRVGAFVAGQSSRTPPRRRGRQHSLYSYMVRNNDV